MHKAFALRDPHFVEHLNASQNIIMGTSHRSPLFGEYFLETIGMVLALLLTKILVVIAAPCCYNEPIKQRLALGLTLSQAGEFALAVFSLAFQSALLTALQYQIAILVVLLSMMTTPLFIYLSQRIIVTPGNQKEDDE